MLVQGPQRSPFHNQFHNTSRGLCTAGANLADVTGHSYFYLAINLVCPSSAASTEQMLVLVGADTCGKVGDSILDRRVVMLNIRTICVTIKKKKSSHWHLSDLPECRTPSGSRPAMEKSMLMLVQIHIMDNIRRTTCGQDRWNGSGGRCGHIECVDLTWGHRLHSKT